MFSIHLTFYLSLFICFIFQHYSAYNEIDIKFTLSRSGLKYLNYERTFGPNISRINKNVHPPFYRVVSLEIHVRSLS